MLSQPRVLLVTQDDAMASRVSSALNSKRRISLGGIHQEVSELRDRLSSPNGQAAVVDIDADPARVLADLRTILSDNPHACVVVVSSKVSEDLLLGAMQAGAKDFLRKESLELELDQVLERVLSGRTSTQVARGSIISVFSVSGGCGATTVALNLANELHLASSERVLLVDLDSHYGTVSTYLEITGQYGIADVLSHNGPVDSHLIESCACDYQRGFHVLLSPAAVEGNRGHRALHYQNLTDALKACRQGYGYTVVDAPRVPDSVATSLAHMSQLALIVFQLTVKDLKSAHSMASLLTTNGIPRENIVPLANRCKRRGPFVRLEDSKRVLGVDSVRCIRSDWRKAMSCINKGRLLAEVAPRSGLRRDFRRLAGAIMLPKGNKKKTILGK